MISKELAQRFIENVTRYTEYNVNIMDGDGTIIASRDPDICAYENTRYYRTYEQELANRLESITAVSPKDASELSKANELWKQYYDALCSYVDTLERSGLIPAWRASLVKGMAAVQQTNALLNLNYDREELPDESLENVD